MRVPSRLLQRGSAGSIKIDPIELVQPAPVAGEFRRGWVDES